MLEPPPNGERAILVTIDFGDQKVRNDDNEFQELAKSAGAEVVAIIQGTRTVPDPKYFVGLGKAEEIRLLCRQHKGGYCHI